MKYRRTHLLIAVAVITALIAGSCLTAVALAYIPSKYSNTDTLASQQLPYWGNYNLIYGDWEVTEYIAEGKGCNQQALENTVGTEISYRYNKVTINKANYSVKQYIPYVIAMEDRVTFIGSDYYPSDEEYIFNIDSAYFVAFSTIFYGDDVPDLILSQIIIKDNNTLVLKTNIGYCILSRVAFLDDIDTLIPSV